jgi:hypothetical protein
MELLNKSKDKRTMSVNVGGTLNNVANEGGAEQLAAMLYLQQKGRSVYANANNVFNDIVGFGFVGVHNECDSAEIVTQDIDETCANTTIGQEVRNSTNCALCRQQVKKVLDGRQELEELAKSKNPSYKIQTADKTFVTRLEGTSPTANEVDVDSVCRYMCFQCAIDDFSQVTAVKLETKCQSFDNFRTSFPTTAFDRAKYHVNQNKASLQDLGYKLTTDADLNQFALNLVTTIKNMTSEETYNTMFNQALLVQQMVIEPTSTSVVIANAQQSITDSQLASIASKVYSDSEFKQSIGYAEKEQNFENTVRLSNIVAKAEKGVSTVRSTLDTAVGKILLSVLLALFAGIMVVGIIWYRRRLREQRNVEFDQQTVSVGQ